MLKAVLALPRTVWLLGLVSLFNDSTSELIYTVPASLVFGSLWQGISPLAAFGFSAACALLAALLLKFWVIRTQPSFCTLL